MIVTLRHTMQRVELDEYLLNAYLTQIPAATAANLTGVKLSYVQAFYNGCHMAITNRGITAPVDMQRDIHALLGGLND